MMRFRRPIVGILLSITIVASATGRSLPAQADSARSPSADTSRAAASWLGGIKSSDRLSGPVVASGTVRGDDGVALSGVLVHASVWPSEGELDAWPADDPVTLTPVAKAVSDGKGKYELRLSADSLQDLPDLSGTRRDVLVTAWTAETGAVDVLDTWTFGEVESDTARVGARRAGTKSKALIDLTVGESPSGSPEAADASAQPSPDDAKPDSSAVPLTIGDGGMSSEPEPPSSQATGCAYSSKNHGLRWVKVGQVYINGTGASGRFLFEEESTSVLGSAVSATGTYGSFSLAGSTVKASEAGVGFPLLSNKTKRDHFSKYNYWTYCVYDYIFSRTTYYTKARWWATGTRSEKSAGFVPKRSRCVPYEPGSKYKKTSTKAINWSGGVKTATAIGINLTARTGFGSSAKVKYWFKKSNTKVRWLCGQEATPGGAPKRLIVRNKRPS